MVTASFSDARSAFIIARLQNQVTLGRRAESGFKKEAWADVTTEFNENFKTEFTREQLKNHFQTLKSSYGIVCRLLDQSGFGWNDTSKTVTAEPREWNAYIAKNSKAKAFRDRQFVHYNALHELIGSTKARGNLRRTAKRAHDELTAEERALDDEADEVEVKEVTDSPKSKLPRVSEGSSEDAASTPLKSKDSIDADHDIDSPAAVSERTIKIATAEGESKQIVSNLPAPTSGPRRIRSNGSHALANSISAVVKLEQEKVGQAPAPTVFVKDKHADMKKAVGVFLQEVKDFLTNSDDKQVGASLLRDEGNAAFFLALDQTMRWEWLVSEIKKNVNSG